MTRTPCDAADDPIADLARRAACGTPRRRPSTTMTASMRCRCDVEPVAAEAHRRAVVRRRVEVVRHAAVAVGGAQQRVLFLDGGSRAPPAPRAAAQAGSRRRRDFASHRREVVVAAADVELQDVERPPRLITVSKTTFRICESIRWPSASTTTECGDVSDMVGMWIIATDVTDNTECVATDVTRQHGMRSHGCHGQHGTRGDHGAVVNVRAAGEERQLWPWQA